VGPSEAYPRCKAVSKDSIEKKFAKKTVVCPPCLYMLSSALRAVARVSRGGKIHSMAKCRKVLPSGRCTKNAVEGRKLCAMHVKAAEKMASAPKKK